MWGGSGDVGFAGVGLGTSKIYFLCRLHCAGHCYSLYELLWRRAESKVATLLDLRFDCGACPLQIDIALVKRRGRMDLGHGSAGVALFCGFARNSLMSRNLCDPEGSHLIL